MRKSPTMLLKACDVRGTLRKEIRRQATQSPIVFANLLSASVPSRQLIANRSGPIRACEFETESIPNTKDSKYRPYLNRRRSLRTHIQRPSRLPLTTDFLQREVHRDHRPDPGVLVTPKNIPRRIISKPLRRSRKGKRKEKSTGFASSPRSVMYGIGFLCLILEPKGILWVISSHQES